MVAVVIVVALTAGLVLGHDLIVKRQTSQLADRAAQGRNVLVAKVFEQPTSRSIDLPATIHGYTEAALYAKVAGYLKTIDVDKGDRVQRGQVIAILETPDLDKQVADAKAAYWLQTVTDRREQLLVRQGVIAQQEADTANASMLEAKATYEQLLAEQGYKEITAPFDGIVTARYVDPGRADSASDHHRQWRSYRGGRHRIATASLCRGAAESRAMGQEWRPGNHHDL